MEDCDTALIKAIRFSDAASVETLIKSGVDADESDCEGNAPLVHLMDRLRYPGSLEDLEVVRTYLRADPRLSVRDHNGFSPFIHLGGADFHMEGVRGAARAVAAMGGDVNDGGAHGITPLMWFAAGHSTLTGIEFLVELGADPKLQDHEGRTALMHAAMNLSGPFPRREVDFLIPLSSIEATDEMGQSALTYGVKASNLGVVKSLIKARADLNIRDKFGNRALSYALSPEVRRILKQAGARP